MTKLSLLALTAILASSPAFAFGPGGQRPSEEEIAAERTELLTAADADGDGALSAAEFATFTELAHAARIQRHFERIDEDGNGLVSSEELENGDLHRRHRQR
jgi:Ca2+-binding EF-hand superfamily protein